MSAAVSVIIPCYNAQRWIGETLRSVFTQGFHDVEVIVVDDGSTDGSSDLVAREFPTVRLVCTPNGGPSRARNLGTQLATGAFIQYLDADDLLTTDKIASQVHLLNETSAEVAYGDWERLVLQSDNSFAVTEQVQRTMTGDPEIALFTDFWCPPAAYLFRREVVMCVVAEFGGWNEHLPVIQDARFTLDCALLGARFAYAPGIVASYRVHSMQSVSRRSATAFVRDCYRNAQDVETIWCNRGLLTDAQRTALITVYGQVARASFVDDPEIFHDAHVALEQLSPGYVPQHPYPLALASRVVGYNRAEHLALLYRKTKGWLRRWQQH